MSLADLLFDDDGRSPATRRRDGRRRAPRPAAEVRDRAAALADELAATGVEPGQVGGGDAARTAPSWWPRCSACGGRARVYVPLNPRLTRHRGRPRSVDAGADPAAARRRGIATGLVRPVESDAGPRAATTPDIALIQFTSGTTGRPKAGAAAPLRRARAARRRDRQRCGGSSVGGEPQREPPMPNLIPVSLSLWAGIYNVLFAFRVGAPVVIMDPFDTGDVRRGWCARFGIRSTVLPPAAMTMLCRRPDDHRPRAAALRAQHHRAAVAAAGPAVPRQVRHRRAQRLRPDRDRRRDRRVERGRLARSSATRSSARSADRTTGVTVRAVDATGRRAVDEAGELWVRTPALSAGYADGADLGDRLTADGWFRTGDIGRVDDDGLRVDRGPGVRHDQPRRAEGVPRRGGGGAPAVAGGGRCRGGRRARRSAGRGAVGLRGAVRRSLGGRPRTSTALEALCRAAPRALQGAGALRDRSTSCPATRSARC